MVEAQDIEQALRQHLSEGISIDLPRIAITLANIANGKQIDDSEREFFESDQAIREIVRSLSGKDISAGNSILSFGQGNQLGDVIVRDIVGGNVTTISVNIYNSSSSSNVATTGRRLIFGPTAAQIVHQQDKGVQTFAASVKVLNFETEAFFIAPFDATQNHWNSVFFYRNGFRTWITSDNTWGYGYFLDKKWHGMHRGALPFQLKTMKGDDSVLRLRVEGKHGEFFVNGRHVGNLEVSAIMTPGSVEVGFSERGYKIEGAITKFYHFSVWSID